VIRFSLPAILAWTALAQTPAGVRISPSTLPADVRTDPESVVIRPNSWTARGFNLLDIVARLYKVRETRVVLPASLDNRQRFDFSLAFDQPEDDAAIDRQVEEAVRSKFGIAIAREQRPMDIFVMTAPRGPSPAMRQLPDPSAGAISSGVTITSTSISATNATMDDISLMLERHLQRIVLDESGLKGRYDFEIKAIPRGANSFAIALNQSLGLDLTRTRREIEMIVVTR
jgi:uncharacterized protein (TIGR03435 family)